MCLKLKAKNNRFTIQVFSLVGKAAASWAVDDWFESSNTYIQSTNFIVHAVNVVPKTDTGQLEYML